MKRTGFNNRKVSRLFLSVAAFSGLAGASVIYAIVGDNSDPQAPFGSNPKINSSTEVVDGRSYDCFTYTEVNRGGISCEDVTHKTQIDDHNSSINASIHEIGGRAYHCFTYTKKNRGGISCVSVTGKGITAANSELGGNDSVVVSHEVGGATDYGQEYDCFAYTAIHRGGVDCEAVQS